MRLGQDVLSDLRSALATEWLVTNGRGGSASGTVIGAHTRRAHATLTTASAHGRRVTLLLKLNERVHAAGAWHHVASNVHAGPAVRPDGHVFLEEFRFDPWPIWRWRVGDVTLQKSIFMVEGHDAVVAVYRHVAGPVAQIAVSPLVSGRDPGALLHAPDETGANGDAGTPSAAQTVPGRVRVEFAGGLPALTLWHNGRFTPARIWVRDLVYPADGATETGEDDAREDALVPCHIEATLEPQGELHLVASSEDDLFKALAAANRLGTPPPRTLRDCAHVLARERHREWAAWRAETVRGADFTARQASVAHGDLETSVARRLTPLIGRDDAWAGRLTDALYACMVRRGDRTTLVSALPRGDERSADALRAVPALVSLRRFDVAKEILAGYADYVNEGLVPESFDPDDGTPVYGDAAPALWLVNAAEVYARRSEDVAFLRDTLYPPLESVMQAYRSGTSNGLRTTEDGLLAVAEDGVEIVHAPLNALWYHALVAMAQLARLVGRRENGAFYLAWARELQKQFGDLLWDEERGCLYECLTPAGPKAGLSAAQLLAASFAPALLLRARSARLVETIGRELVTPLGVRARPGSPSTLAWVGPYVTAYLRAHDRAPEALRRMRAWTESVRAACERVSAGHAPDGFTADSALERPSVAGEPCSLLSAAELLRAWIEEIDHSHEPAPESQRAVTVRAAQFG
jgi:hypothetical protein